MVPFVRVAQMRQLEKSDPNIWQECESGNFYVNKNVLLFCGFGPDHAVEHLNRWMKVSGGIVGITLNESARARFFLIAPEMARLAEEVSNMADISSSGKTTHHDLSETYMQRQEKAITYEGKDLINIITKTVIPEEVEKDMLKCDKIGDLTCKKFVEERIVRAEVNLWSPSKKLNLKTWKSAHNMVRHQLEDKIVELKEDTSLFARLLIVAKSRPEINLQEAIGRYLFSSLLRSMFALNGTLPPCTDKSNLMTALESLPTADIQGQDELNNGHEMKVTVIDGMAAIQNDGQTPVAYKITDSTNISNTTKEKYLSHNQPKAELCILLKRQDIMIRQKQ